jgi:phosphate-selective porin OprO/OprP
VTTAPVRRDNIVVHFGVATELREATNGVARYRARPESYLTSQRLVDTGTILDVTDLRTTGLEFGAKLGRFSLRAERIESNVSRNGPADLAFEGDYATLGVMLTGESISYSRRNGTFGGVEPKHRWGALELAARASRLDLEDRDVLGGIERNRTVGVNWYLGARFRLMVDRIEIDAEPNRSGVEEHPSILQIRFQATL